MALPNFLMIGAMKAGTTSMYVDLSQHPDVAFGNVKEPGNLASDEVLSERGRETYRSLYRRARPGQRCGDATTEYAKLPDIPGVAQRARSVLGPDVRIVYLVREPVSRAISHHHHLVARRLAPPGFEEAVAAVPALVDYGCYARQLEPWVDTFGSDAVLVAGFEEYLADRQRVVDSVLAHIGLAPHPELRASDGANRTDVDPPATGRAAQVRDNPVYRRLVRPVVPSSARTRLRRIVLPSPPPRPDPPSTGTVEKMVAVFEPEERQLRELVKRESPWWDFDSVVGLLRVSEGVVTQPGAGPPAT